MKQKSHDRIQQELFTYIINTYPETRKTIWHTPNEHPRSKGQSLEDHRRELRRRFDVGVVKGVTDLVWYWKGVLYIFDIKIGKDSLSEDQIKFINAIENQGGKFYEINSVEQGISIVDGIIK